MLHRQTTTRSLLNVLAVWTGLMLAVPVRAQKVDETKALKVKAAYLYNFAKFIEWPDYAFSGEETPFVIGVLGDDPFGQYLDDTVRAKKIAGRPVQIQRIRWSDLRNRARLTSYQVLYISKSGRIRLKETLAALEGQPNLLVSDIAGFASDGGMIGFVLKKQRIVFEINREALGKAKLKASAKLLKLAQIVKPKEMHPPGTQTPKGKPEWREHRDRP